MHDICFFSEETSFKLSQEHDRVKWLKSVLQSYQRSDFALNIIFVSDEKLRQMNQEFLRKSYYTDVITFDNSDAGTDLLEADVFISVDRVRENAIDMQIDFQDELDRVMVHGVLHLLGFKDKIESEQLRMRQAEDQALNTRSWFGST
jgi:rRNA maturation RNase YbeY